MTKNWERSVEEEWGDKYSFIGVLSSRDLYA